MAKETQPQWIAPSFGRSCFQSNPQYTHIKDAAESPYPKAGRNQAGNFRRGSAAEPEAMRVYHHHSQGGTRRHLAAVPRLEWVVGEVGVFDRAATRCRLRYTMSL